MSSHKQLIPARPGHRQIQRGKVLFVLVACLTVSAGKAGTLDRNNLVPLTSINARDCSGLLNEPEVLFHSKNEIDLPSSDTTFIRLAELDVHDEESRACLLYTSDAADE